MGSQKAPVLPRILGRGGNPTSYFPPSGGLGEGSNEGSRPGRKGQAAQVRLTPRIAAQEHEDRRCPQHGRPLSRPGRGGGPSPRPTSSEQGPSPLRATKRAEAAAGRARGRDGRPGREARGRPRLPAPRGFPGSGLQLPRLTPERPRRAPTCVSAAIAPAPTRKQYRATSGVLGPAAPR